MKNRNGNMDVPLVCRVELQSSVHFVGHRQAEQAQNRRRRTQCLIRVSTVCLQNVLLKFESK